MTLIDFYYCGHIRIIESGTLFRFIYSVHFLFAYQIVEYIIYKWYGLNGVGLYEYDGVKLLVFSIIFTILCPLFIIDW